MKLITAPGGTVIKIYGSAKEMPSKRYSQFQKRLLLQAGVGSDLDSISGHFTKLYGYVAEVMTDDAKRECENLHYSIYSVLNSIDFTSQAFACLVAEIGGEHANDLSDDGLQRVSDAISEAGISVADLESAVEEVKKKITEELRLFFPRLFTEDSDMAYFEKLKQKLMLTGELLLSLDEVEKGNIQKRIREIQRYFLEHNRPQCFNESVEDNCLLEIDRTFGALCAMLDSNGTSNSQELCLFDFYARIDYLNRPTVKA